MRAKRRRGARAAKAAKLAPRPADGPLRPVVRCMTAKYNMRARLGKGFSLEELKEAGVAPKYAPTIGISVDPRRKNRSVEGMMENVQRLKEYQTKLIVFPRNPAKPKAGDASKEDLAMAAQLKGTVMPLARPVPEIEVRAITAEDKASHPYRSIRIERSNKRLDGVRRKRLEEERKKEEDKKK